MSRTVLTVLVLAALGVASAHGSPVPPAKPHKTAHRPTASNKTTQPIAAHAVRRTTRHIAGRPARRETGVEAIRKYPEAGRQRTGLTERHSEPYQGRATRIASRSAKFSARKTAIPFRRTELSATEVRVSSRRFELSARQAVSAPRQAELPAGEAAVPTDETEVPV